MKRLCLLIMLVIGFAAPFAAATGQAGAVNIFGGCGNDSAGGTPDACQEAKSQGTVDNPVIRVIQVGIDILSFIVGIASIVGIVVGSLRLIMSNGDSGSVASARSSIVFSLVGVAVVIFAQLFVTFVLSKINL